MSTVKAPVSTIIKTDANGAPAAASAGTDYVAPGLATSSGLTVNAQYRVLGRITTGSGAIEELTIDTDLSSVSGSDDELASSKAIKAALDGKLAHTGGTLTNYLETAAQPTDTTSPIVLSMSDGNVQYRTLTESTTFYLPAKSSSGQALSLLLYIIGASTYTLSIKDANNGTTDMLDISSPALSSPGNGKRTLITATSINGSVWFVNQIYKES